MSENLDTYRSISGPGKGLFKDNGSRFLAFSFPVENEEDVKTIVNSIRKEFHDARHHCFAYRIGKDGEKWRVNDDGEPSGSAGKPILGQIDSAGLSDVLVVVVRYFGGIKLGIPGLIRAYRTSSAEALSSVRKIDKVAGEWYRLDFPYEKLPAVMKVAKDLDLPQRSQAFGGECSLEVRVRLSFKNIFFERIEKIANFTLL